MPSSDDNCRYRIRLDATGVVQGVGFRPYVSRLAARHGLAGFVQNRAGVVRIEIEGTAAQLAAFEAMLQQDLPLPARIEHITRSAVAPDGGRRFEIAASADVRAGTPTLLPDTVTCPDCLAEMRDAANRRYRYPFISCATCGPRYSIVEDQPFDRTRTALRDFPMCPICAAEYADPADRRFHAQTISCPGCGPRLSLIDFAGQHIADGDAALQATVGRLQAGDIVALKGLGGFQLVTDAGNAAAIQRLRQRKQRPAKPFATMVRDLAMAHSIAVLDTDAENLLRDRAGAIVLLRRKPAPWRWTIADAVAPENPMLGLMLPSSGLHALLLDAIDRPLVVTSGNRSGEPIAIDNAEARQQLAGIADCLLVHDRRITHRLDDSVLQFAAGRAQLLRRARGHVPLTLPLDAARGLLASGAQQKNTVAVSLGGTAVLSQHNGDLDSVAAIAQHQQAADELTALLGEPLRAVVGDANTDYASSATGRARAERLGIPYVPVWHHLAHAHAAIAEHALRLPCTAITWDGSGTGGGDVVRGGECFVLAREGATRIASLRPFPLPGGDRAVEEPRRAALGLLWAFEGEAAFARDEIATAFAAGELATLASMLRSGVRCPPCTSIGRLFDAVSCLLGLRHKSAFEGDAAMQLQFAAERGGTGRALPFAFGAEGLDWRPMLHGLLTRRNAGATRDALAADFHASLAALVVALAQRGGHHNVVLSGGCFQNRLLLEDCTTQLEAAGFRAHWPERVPPNDGGLALGQLAAAHFGHLVASETPIEES